MVRLLRTALLVTMLLYGGGFAAALHRATHHHDVASVCDGHTHGQDNGTDPAAPTEDEDHDDCPECTLLTIGGVTTPPPAFVPVLDESPSSIRPYDSQFIRRFAVETGRPRAPPHHS